MLRSPNSPYTRPMNVREVTENRSGVSSWKKVSRGLPRGTARTAAAMRRRIRATSRAARAP
jgi:hypothetical protein